MAKEQARDSEGNVYYVENDKPVDGVIDPETGLYVAGVISVEDLQGITRDPFTNKPLPDIEARSILPRVGKSLVKIFQYLWQAFFVIPIKYWLPLFGQWLSISTKFYGHKFIAMSKAFRSHVAGCDYMTPELKKQLDAMLASDDAGDVLTGIMLSLPWYSMNVLSTFNIIQTVNMHQKMAEFTPALLDAPMYTNLLFRSPDRENEINKYYAWLGLSSDQQDVLKATLKPLISIIELAQLRWRGEISEAEFKSNVAKFGYNQDDQEKLYKLIWFVPPVNDLVRFAVREAFTPEIITKYELGADFPHEFAEQAQKVGLSEEWAKRYWYAHWELPPINMGFEMMHRGVINKDDMDLLLRTKDVMPYWRDKITSISYRPYSRVDVRRMYAAGVLNRDEVKRSYLDLGYDNDKASKMTDFTIVYTTKKEKGLSKSDLLGAFTSNLVSETDCLRELMEIGYSESDSKILILRAKFGKFKAKKELSLGNVKKMFMTGLYDETAVIEHLAVLRVQSDEMADLMDLWKIEKEAKRKVESGLREKDLTKSDILGSYKDGIISEKQCEIELIELGYDTAEAGVLVARVNLAKKAKLKGLTMSKIKKLFTLKLYDSDQTAEALKQAGQSFDSIKDLIALWSAEEQIEFNNLPEPILMNLIKAKIISTQEWIVEMRKIKFSDTQIEWLHELYTGTKIG